MNEDSDIALISKGSHLVCKLDAATATSANISLIQDVQPPSRSTQLTFAGQDVLQRFVDNDYNEENLLNFPKKTLEEVSDSSLERLIPSYPGSPRFLSWHSQKTDRSLTSVKLTPHFEEKEEEIDPELKKAIDFLHSDNDLIYACEIGNDHLVKELIRNGEDVNIRDPIGRTALHFAVQNNSIPVITLLLEAGANASVMDNVGLTPLSICLMRKPSVKVARLLFDHGAVILPRINPVSTGLFLQFSMMCIPTPEETGILALLIEKGALINDPAVPGGRSALHFAAMSNNCELINVLVSFGANLFATNHRGETPFDVAVTFQCKKAVECLREYIGLSISSAKNA